MARISVIVPVYKVEEYLDRCVNSVLGQTFPDFELILVDDGSPDNCGAMCDAWAETDSRVRVIHKKNGGVSSARNAGLALCRGDYIAFLDSDDWYHPQALEWMLRAGEEFGTDGVTMNSLWTAVDNPEVESCRYHEVGKVLLPRKQIHSGFYRLAFGGGAVKDSLTCGLYGMYRRECFAGIRFDETIACGEDVLVLFRLNLGVASVVHLNTVLYYYYTGNQSAMRSGLSCAKLTVLDALVKAAQALQPLPRQAEMVEYRYIYCYFDFLHRAEAAGDPALAEGFQWHREVFRGQYPRLGRNPHLSPAEKWMLRLYKHKIPLWRRLFGKCEGRMLEILQGFLEE